MEKRLKDMCSIPDTVLEKLQKDIEEIKTALLGNEYNPTGGLLCRTTELEKTYELVKRDLERMSRKYDKIIWTAVGAGSIISFTMTLIGIFADKLF